MKLEYSRSELAKSLGIARSSVTYLVKQGLLEVNEKGLISLTNPRNLAYVDSKKGDKNSENIEKEKHKIVRKNINMIKKSITNIKPTIDDSNYDIEQFKTKSTRNYLSKTDADVQRIQAQTANLQLKYAERMKVLILREVVEKAFGNFDAIIHNYLLPLGERMAPILAAMCGVSDQDIIIKIREKVDKEIMRVLEAVKKQIENKI